MFPSRAMAFSRSTASGLPTTSLSVCGRYFSTWAQQTRARNEGGTRVSAGAANSARTGGARFVARVARLSPREAHTWTCV
jgi:hypothetical protein